MHEMMLINSADAPYKIKTLDWTYRAFGQIDHLRVAIEANKRTAPGQLPVTTHTSILLDYIYYI